MTNNDELALKLKAAAEIATPGEWERGDGKHGGELLVYCDDALGSAVCEATSTYNSIPKLQRISNLTFIATANPANILALLAERDADKALIAKLEQIAAGLEKRLRETEETMIGATDMLRELEARTVSVKLPHQTDFDDPLSAYEAIAQCREALFKSCAAAGIKLEVGE